MLNDYKTTQQVTYKILKNAILNDKCSHAYLIETGGFYDYLNFTMAFVKSLMCPKKNLEKINCGECHQCEVIESGNFPEIEIIKPDGQWIKKEQLQKLQKEFETKPLIGNKRIYIIQNAERLNKSAANSILKFLEEPEGSIIAILLTDNIYSILTTIRSRCQILRLKQTINKQESELDKIKQIINNETMDEEKINKVVELVNYYEKNHLNTLLYFGKLWNDYIKTKDEMYSSFEIMTLYYKDILNSKLNKQLEIFEQSESINQIAEKNTINQICTKINIITNLKEKIKYNANTGLLMDKLIISLEGGI